MVFAVGFRGIGSNGGLFVYVQLLMMTGEISQNSCIIFVFNLNHLQTKNKGINVLSLVYLDKYVGRLLFNNFERSKLNSSFICEVWLCP